MVNMVFLQWVNPKVVFVEMNPVGPDPRMLENVYKSVLFPLPVAIVRFAMAAGVHNIVA